MPMHYYDVEPEDDGSPCERVYTGFDTADVVIAKYVMPGAERCQECCTFEMPVRDLFGDGRR